MSIAHIELPVLGQRSGRKKREGRCGGRCRSRCRCRGKPRAAVTLEPLEGRVLLSTITGTIFSDRNRNGVQDSGEPGLSAVVVFLDANNDGILESGETWTTTSSAGAYSFTVTNAPNKTYVVAQQMPSGYAAAAPIGNAVATQNIDITKRSGNESEAAIAIDPTNPSRVFMASNVASGSFLVGGYSTDGGATWTTRNLATGSDGLVAACCDPSLAWDAFGNLFMAYLNSAATQVIVARSTNGGQSFTQIATLGATDVDQPTVAVGPGQNGAGGSVWVVFNQPTNNGATDVLKLAGATVSALGNTGAFTTATVPSGNGSYGDVAVGPNGQVMVVYQQTGTNQAPSQVYMNVDPDGLGSTPLAARVTLLTTNVGDFDFIPAQSTRSVDAEVGLAWDRSDGGAHNGRVYLLYTGEAPDESNNMDVYVKYSDNSGGTWSTPVKVNDDATTRSQFLPRIALDETTGNLAVTWHDARRDDGLHGAGDTNGIANDDAQFWGTMSTNGGASFLPNIQISDGTSNAAAAADGIDYGDYTGLAFQSGTFMPIWADNTNSTGNNPNGALSKFDVYTARVTALPAGSAGRYSVVAGSTQGASGLNFADHDVTAPTVTITPVSPNPRTSGVSSITITFSEAVSGFNLSDLQLSRGGSANLLTASQALTTTNNITYTLGTLAGITSTAGSYTLTLNAAGSGITDLSGNALANSTSRSFIVNSTIAGRFVFYNGSAYDGGDESTSAADDGAIAPDKTPLLPGQTAAFMNYTSFFHGINGVMIDVAGLANAAGLSASDFTFAAGTSTDPSGWTPAPAPLAVNVRSGAGGGGSDRITLVWADNAIQNTWLQVTVLANNDTGLAAPDVFYFGNLIGETGNNSAAAQVTASDIGLTKFMQGRSATITSPVDFNRNGQITSADVAVVKAYQGGQIPLFGAPATAPVTATAAAAPTATRTRSTPQSPAVPFSDVLLPPLWPEAEPGPAPVRRAWWDAGLRPRWDLG